MTEKHLFEAPYATTAFARLRDALVVPPAAALDRIRPIYGEPSPIIERAREQHAVMVKTLESLGVRVHSLAVEDGMGYATFIADCALIAERGAIMLRPTQIERRPEVALVEARLRSMGIPIIGRIEAPAMLDGADVVATRGVAYLGVPKAARNGARSNTLGRAQFEQHAAGAGLRTVEVAIAPEVVRLSNVLSFVDEDLAVAATDYVDAAPLAGKVRIVEIPRGDQYGAGVIVVAPRRVLANLRFRVALPLMRKAKVDVTAIDLWEFGKIGRTPASLILPLKRG